MDAGPPSCDSTALPGCWVGTVTVHNRHHVFWVVRGSASVLVDGEIHRLRTRDALWIPGGTPVDQISTSPGTVAFTVLLPLDALHDVVTVVLRRGIPQEVSLLLLHLFSRWKMPAWDGGTVNESIAGALRACFCDKAQSVVDRPRMPESAVAVEIARELTGNPGDARTRGEWARCGGISERQLTRLFHVQTGMSFASWRAAVKAVAAADRVSAGEKVGDVAVDLGYSGAPAMSRAFRRYAGMTLTSLRKGAESDPVRRASAIGTPLDVLIPADRMPPSINSFHVLIGVLRGSCTVVLCDRRFTLDGGQMIWLPAGVRHQITAEPGSVVFPFAWLTVDHPLSLGDVATMNFSGDTVYRLLYLASAKYTRLHPYPVPHDLMTDLIPRPCGGEGPGRSSRRGWVTEMIVADPGLRLSLDDWAGTLGVNRAVLVKAFRSATGQSYRDWIVDRRITVARKLLVDPDRTVEDVASELGYSSSASFLRAFRGRTGITPGKYQRIHRNREIFETVE